MVAKQPIELLQGVTLIMLADTVGDAELFVGVQMSQSEYARFVVLLLGEGGCRSGSEGEAEKMSPIHNFPGIVILVVSSVEIIPAKI